MSVSAAVVHTTGFNWDSLATLILAIFVAVGGGIAFVVKRIDRNRDHTQKFINGQVTSVSDALSGRLDRIDTHLVAQDGTVAQQGERLARVEGRLMIAGIDGKNP